MKEIGVLMKPALAKAAREGSKTNTRRIINPQPREDQIIPKNWSSVMVENKNAIYGDGLGWSALTEDGKNHEFRCPYGKPGDILWIREVHYRYGHWLPNGISEKTGRQKFKFEALSETTMFPEEPPTVVLPNTYMKPGWYKRNSLFMPRSCARTLLKVEEVRVERLLDISDEDAESEGITFDYNLDCLPGPGYFIVSFAKLWESINGPGSWFKNPWVWVIKFRSL